jgi:hypothetical protein
MTQPTATEAEILEAEGSTQRHLDLAREMEQIAGQT